MGRLLPQLSIVIPALRAPAALETTLVSVLQNRPDDCEIVVLVDRAFDDPYDLAGEVRFVALPDATSLGAELARGLEVARGSVVNVLTAGVEVEEGWAYAALAHFCDNRVAAVAPLVLAARDVEHVCSGGLEYTVGGARRRRAAPQAATDVLGPTLYAGFYRRDVLAALPAPFDDRVTAGLLDVDLALQIRAAGYRAVVEPRSLVYRADARLPETAPFAAARGAERVFWRNAPSVGWLRSVAAHGLTVARDVVAPGSPSQFAARLLGRIVGCCEWLAYRRHHQALAAMGKPGLAYTVTSTGDNLRIDAAHPRSHGAAKAPRTADFRRDGGSEQAA